ncbi:MAG: hypothetical protein KDB26_10450 [Microthrixaceae bacterium]|nr:hypothetical protein [Microthrixaceae bacterium]
MSTDDWDIEEFFDPPEPLRILWFTREAVGKPAMPSPEVDVYWMAFQRHRDSGRTRIVPMVMDNYGEVIVIEPGVSDTRFTRVLRGDEQFRPQDSQAFLAWRDRRVEPEKPQRKR